MQMNVHLNFKGNCKEAFDFYQKVFGVETSFVMTYGDAPTDAMPSPPPPELKDKIMHMSIPLGDGLLMGCDAPEGRSTPLGGFQVSIESTDEAEVRRIYAALSEGGTVQMPIATTFWSPLFGMATDKFGVAWMVSLLPNPPQNPRPQP